MNQPIFGLPVLFFALGFVWTAGSVGNLLGVFEIFGKNNIHTFTQKEKKRRCLNSILDLLCFFFPSYCFFLYFLHNKTTPSHRPPLHCSGLFF